MSVHDDFKSKTTIKSGSDRSFGVTFSVVGLIFGVWPWLFRGEPLRVWSLAIAVAFAGAALWVPKILSPLNKIWFRFGLILHKTINPVIMGAIFYFAIVPMGLIIRLTRKDLLRLRLDSKASTYWIERSKDLSRSMLKQF